MSELLPCPLCGHLNGKPSHHSKFMCEAPSCRKWLELRKDHTQLNDYIARREADEVRIDRYWRDLASAKAEKEGIDFETAHKLVLETRDKNNRDMRAAARVRRGFACPPLKAKAKAKTITPVPTATNFTNTTKPMVAMSTTSDDDSNAPF